MVLYRPLRWSTEYGLRHVEATVARHWIGKMGTCDEERELWLAKHMRTAGFVVRACCANSSLCTVSFTLTEHVAHTRQPWRS